MALWCLQTILHVPFTSSQAMWQTQTQPHHYHLPSSRLRPSESCVPIRPETWQCCMAATFQHSWLMTGRHRTKCPIRHLKTKLAKQEEEKASTVTICDAMQTKRVSMGVPLTSWRTPTYGSSTWFRRLSDRRKGPNQHSY